LNFLVAIVLVLAGCTVDRGPVLTSRNGASPAASHAVTGAELRRTMATLDRVRPDRMPQELAGQLGAHEELAAVGETAREMAMAADAIPLAIEGVRLDPTDRERFLELAARLRAQALAIAGAADDEDAASVRRHVSAVEITCNDCHSAFRVLPATVP